jgi:AcrR family transcriptional regulator
MSDGGPTRSGPAAAIQRERILDAVVEVVDERGAVGASVEMAIARARVSRRTFYERFGGLEECLVALLEGVLERVVALAARSFDSSAPGVRWYDGMRAALAAVLGFFDSEPALARVCLVESLAAGPLVRERRDRIIDAFRELVVARIESEVSHASPLAPEAVMGSVISVVYARLAAREQAPLLDLVGPLMGVIVGPFMDEEGVAGEIEKGDALARELLSGEARARAFAADVAARARVAVPDALLAPRAHRARRCMLYVACNPGASSGEVGRGIGVEHRGQVGKLLGRLAALGLLVNSPGGPGRPNAWRTTPVGTRVARELAGDGEWAGDTGGPISNAASNWTKTTA